MFIQFKSTFVGSAWNILELALLSRVCELKDSLELNNLFYLIYSGKLFPDLFSFKIAFSCPK